MAHKDTNQDYLLTRDYRSRTRLDLQHYRWQETLGYYIHPDIRLPSTPLTIADVGTGTGLWPISLSKQLPGDTTIIGTDISLGQTPPKTWLPNNVSFQIQDIFQDVPDDLIQRFDLIHVRLLVFVVPVDRLPAVVDRLISMLKPGGYLQWEDLDPPSRIAVKATPDLSDQKFMSFDRDVRALNPRMTASWVPTLDSVFRRAGLQHVRKDLYVPSDDQLSGTSDNILMGLEEVISKLPAGQVKQELVRRLPEAAAEVAKGVSYTTTTVVVVGQRL